MDVTTKVIYQPILAKVLDGITPALLLSQINYWSSQVQDTAFYKFRSPCTHSAYKPGDSWTEELSFGNTEFDSALKKIATKVKTGASKHEILQDTEAKFDENGYMLNADHLVLYWITEGHLTHYELNRPLYQSLLANLEKANSLFLNRVKPIQKTLNANSENLKRQFRKPKLANSENLNQIDQRLPETTTKTTQTNDPRTHTQETVNMSDNELPQASTKSDMLPELPTLPLLPNQDSSNDAKLPTTPLIVDPNKLKQAVQACTALITVDGRSFVNGVSHFEIKRITETYQPDDVIEACRLTGNRPSLPYMERILEHWKAHGRDCQCKKPAQPTANQVSNASNRFNDDPNNHRKAANLDEATLDRMIASYGGVGGKSDWQPYFRNSSMYNPNKTTIV